MSRERMLAKRVTRNGCVEVVAAKFMRKKALQVLFEWQVEILQAVLSQEIGLQLGTEAGFPFFQQSWVGLLPRIPTWLVQT